MSAVAELVLADIMTSVEQADEIRGVIGNHPVSVLLPVKLAGKIRMITMGERVKVKTSAHVHVRRVNVNKRCGVAGVTMDNGHSIYAQYSDPGCQGADRNHPFSKLVAVESSVDLVVARLPNAADRARIEDS
jgi:hypothetical protein